MIEVRTLGSLEVSVSGQPLHSLVAQPKRLALLTYLCVARPRGFHRRDTLVGVFWPESDQAHARTSLRNALHVLRRLLGPDAIQSRGDEDVGIDPAIVWCDAAVFDDLLTDGRCDEAAGLYRGDFLAGFFVSDLPELEGWMDAERSRLKRCAAVAMQSAADRCRDRGDIVGAVALTRRSLEVAPPFDEAVLRHAVELLADAGDNAGALEAYERFAHRLAADYQSAPSAETAVVFEQIRARRAAAPVLLPLIADENPPSSPAAVPAAPSARHPSRWRRTTLVASSLVLIPALAFWRYERERAADPPISSLVVLPVENLSNDTTADFFVEGVQEGLTQELAQIPALRVISRTSAMHYRRTEKTIPQIARELGIDAVVEAAALASAGRVRVDVRLIHAVPERLVWAHSYRGDMAGLPALHREITADIADRIRASLTERHRARLARASPVNVDAYEAYMRGLYAAHHSYTPAGLSTARMYLERAVELDAGFAQAHAGLATVTTISAMGHGGMAAAGLLPRAKAAAVRALELDDGLSDAHAALALVHLFYDWDWSGSEREAARAIALAPSSAWAHFARALALAAAVRFDEAVAENRQAQQLDPFLPIITSDMGKEYYLVGKPDLGIAEARKCLALQPDFPPCFWVLGAAYRAKGQFVEAVAAHERGAALSPYLKPFLAETYALAGRHSDARRVLMEMGPRDRQQLAFPVAVVYAALGERDEVFRWLDVAYAGHSPGMRELGSYPTLQSIRSDRRYEELRRRVGLPR